MAFSFIHHLDATSFPVPSIRHVHRDSLWGGKASVWSKERVRWISTFDFWIIKRDTWRLMGIAKAPDSIIGIWSLFCKNELSLISHWINIFRYSSALRQIPDIPYVIIYLVLFFPHSVPLALCNYSRLFLSRHLRIAIIVTFEFGKNLQSGTHTHTLDLR